MLVFAATMSLAAAAVEPTAPACPPIRVMTYNIRLDIESDGPNRWSERRGKLIGQIRLLQPAILGLQEVVAGQKSDLQQGLPGYAFLGVARDDGASAGEFSSVAVDLSVFTVASSGTFWLSPTPDVPSKGWDAAFPRIATWAHLVRKSDGRRFLALNTHLDNAGKIARLEGAQQIVRWLSTHRLHGESAIVTGDLNSEPGSPPVEAMTSPTLGLRDSRTASIEPLLGPTGTFNGFQALPKASRRIDYVLVDPAIEVNRYAVLAMHGEDGRVASDHFPVVADLAACGP
jgi:endonuclease/exonuclease/phosphatase family metal-dependent hydrolase